MARAARKTPTKRWVEPYAQGEQETIRKNVSMSPLSRIEK